MSISIDSHENEFDKGQKNEWYVVLFLDFSLGICNPKFEIRMWPGMDTLLGQASSPFNRAVMMIHPKNTGSFLILHAFVVFDNFG